MTLGSLIGAAIAAVGGREVWARRDGGKGSRPPPGPSLQLLAAQCHDLHTLAYTPDQDGVPLHARLTTAISATARGTKSMAADSERQTQLLEQIASSLKRERVPTLPGD